MIFKKLFCLAFAAAILTGCHNHSHNHSDDHNDADLDADHEEMEEHEHDIAGGVHFTNDMSWGVEFATDSAVYMNIGNTIHTIAQIQPSQTDEVMVIAKTDGVITLNNITEGQKVTGGMLLGNVDATQTASGNLSVQQQHALIELERSESEYNKKVALHAERLATDSELRKAKAEYETAKASVATLLNGFSAGAQKITSPKGGYIKQLFVKNGEYISTGNPIASITQNNTLQLKAEIPASYYPDLSKYYDAVVNGTPIGELGGRMLSYSHQVSTENPLIPVFFEIKNVSNFLPGTFVDMYIKTASNSKLLCVASGAIMEDSGINYVYVQHSEDYFEKRLVTTGATDGIYTEIKSGLKEGEMVVTKGAMLVKMQQSTGSVDPHSGHQH